MVLKDQKQRVNIVLNESQRRYLQKISAERGLSASEFIRELIEEKKREEQKERLSQAADTLASEYRQNEELTAFTALDGEDVQ
jgi:predicted CopG family antitoxin